VKALERGERDGGWMMDDESAVQYIVSREIHTRLLRRYDLDKYTYIKKFLIS
jgi:hypothetical protein